MEVLFLLGMGLLALEIFVIPGFGVFGVSGILLTMGSLILASHTFSGMTVTESFEESMSSLGSLAGAMVTVASDAMWRSMTAAQFASYDLIILGDKDCSGSVILPMVAQVAALDPDTAAKMVQPITLVCSRRPGRPCTQGARPLNMSWLNRVRKRISPIHTNRGRAVSVQLLLEPHTVTAMASPAGRAENSVTAIQATPVSVRPTQTPLPRISSNEPLRNE